MNFMTNINFKINSISSGWFDIELLNGEQSISICASNAWENDSPKYLLSLLIDLLTGKANAGYVVFDEEPGTYIMCIQFKSQISLEIYFSNNDDDEWGNVPLHGNLTSKELFSRIPIDKNLLMIDNLNMESFVSQVVQCFDTYASKHKRDKYEGNWMKFPLEEYQLLKAIVDKNC